MLRSTASGARLLTAASAISFVCTVSAQQPYSVVSVGGGEEVTPLEIAQVFSDGSVGQWHPYVTKHTNEDPATTVLTFGSAESTGLRSPGPVYVPTDGAECGGFGNACFQPCAQTRRLFQSCAFTYGGIRISAISSVNSRGERGNVGQVFLAWTNKRGPGQLDDFNPPRVIGDTVIEVLIYDGGFDPNCGAFEPNLVGGVLVNFGPLDGKCGTDNYYFSTLNLREFPDVCMTIPGPVVNFGYEVAFWYDANRTARAANNQAMLWGVKDQQQQGVTDDLGYADLNYDGSYTAPAECLPLAGGGCPSILAAAVDFWGDSDPGFINLWDNGTFVTQLHGGCSGGDASIIEAPSSAFGFNTLSTAFHQADDFTVPSGQVWEVDDMTWYLYQTNSSPSLPITQAVVQVWDGPPGDGGMVIAGDLVTNRLVGSEFSNIYRASSSDPTNCSRAVKKATIDMTWVPNLGAGTYWIELGTQGDPGFSGPWAPPTVPRDLGNDNSRLFTVSTGAWTANLDATAGVPFDFPFELRGKIISGGGCDVSQYTLGVTGTCPGVVTVSWQNATPSTQQGIVFGARLGSTVIPPGSACEGTRLGISGSVRLVTVVSTGANGSGSVNGQANANACGGYLQLVEAGSCRTSTIAQLP